MLAIQSWTVTSIMVTEKPNRKDNILKYASAVALYSQRLRNEFIANYKRVQSEQQPEVHCMYNQTLRVTQA